MWLPCRALPLLHAARLPRELAHPCRSSGLQSVACDWMAESLGWHRRQVLVLADMCLLSMGLWSWT